MKSSTSTLPRPVINCTLLSNFQFNSIDPVTIKNLKFDGCLNIKVSMVLEFTIEDSILKQFHGRALTVTASNVNVIRSSFTYSDGGVLYLSTSSIHIEDWV